MACACLNWNATQRSCLSRWDAIRSSEPEEGAERMASKVRYGEVWDRKAVKPRPAQKGSRHGHVLDTDCRPDSPRRVGRTFLHRRSPAVCPEAARNIGLGLQG